ncbi:MAG: fimbrillin family protein [Bacteroidales bacterium]|nr:fimbrillin family protein [Bacteroidales bacterium]
MKRTNIYLAAAAVILALAGCAKEPASTGEDAITVKASVGTMTKVHTEGMDTGFDAGDKIAVYAWTGSAAGVPAIRVVDGVANTLGSDGKWTPDSPMLWKTMTTPHFFLGIYPAPDAVADFAADPYPLDPAPESYAKSDLLIATNFGTGGEGLTAAGGAVPLEFYHAMARLEVNLRFRGELATTPAVSSITVSANTTATVNYATKAVTATGTASDVPLTALGSPETGYVLRYGGLQVPQAIRKITVIIGAKEYVYESSSDITLAGGKLTTLGLAIGKDSMELGSVSVTDWTVASDLPGGEAQYVPNVLDLSTLTGDTRIEKDLILTGTTTYKLTLADDVKVTLSGVNITNPSFSIKCEGDATVILADGTDNTLNAYDPASASYPALWAGPTGTTLTIDGTGSLTATGGLFSASIGGPRNGTCGNITIKGGTINAYGSKSGAGIGSGNESSCGDIIISGGTVTTNGGDGSAGIGSGYKESKCGVITISGGTIIANGGENGAGIGSGCYESKCGNIIISGGTLTANGYDSGAGIGSGYYQSECGDIIISGGTIIANGGEKGAGIGSGFSKSECGDITISGGVVTAVKGDSAPNSIGAGFGSSTCGTVTIGGKEGAKSENFAIAFLGSLTKDLSVETDMTLTGTTSHSVTIADGKTVTLDGASISTYAFDAFGILCLGDATIVLADGSENMLDTQGTALCPGPSGKTLTIEGNTGKLVSSSDSSSAIGGNYSGGNIGNIVINGGIIEAYGGIDSAAIGSGHENACGDIAINGGDVTAMAGGNGAAIGTGEDGTCGNIEITDGKVKATGGAHATGIGTGRGNNLCDSITITGGTVEAYGGYECPAIGCAKSATCSDITISGGSGTAYAGDSCSYSIGSYDGGFSCGLVTIDNTETGSISQSPYSWNL